MKESLNTDKIDLLFNFQFIPIAMCFINVHLRTRVLGSFSSGAVSLKQMKKEKKTCVTSLCQY